MAQQLPGSPQLLALVEEERGEGMPQVVQVQPVQSSRVPQLLETPPPS